MPAGIPVATLAVGKAGARNAGLLAVQILALSDPGLTEALQQSRGHMRDRVTEKSELLQQRLQDLRSHGWDF
jgi:5-(carboxyamino)imidazole ribonucleotide mutase